jgi:hypothetical protein
MVQGDFMDQYRMIPTLSFFQFVRMLPALMTLLKASNPKRPISFWRAESPHILCKMCKEMVLGALQAVVLRHLVKER